MTEYWVSQGNKWCDFCKIYIANNPLSIRTHELGQRHKDSVAKRLASMRKENAAKEKEHKDAQRAIEQIEAKAKRSYQKDLAAFQVAKDSNVHASEACEEIPETAKSASASGDGKWVTQEEAFASPQVSTSDSQNLSESKYRKPNPQKSSSAEVPSPIAEDKDIVKRQGGNPPGLVVPASRNPMRSVKGAPSSIAVSKRKREDGKPKVVSKEEEAALKAREAAKKRVEEREKPLLGLYRSY
ncbi:zinc finger protein ZOP1 isoform X2 [Magnolia sinica]|uniref:zinc finger protein ZOP1 isoform X2 n=1 Tax=Magnolia sinica TaxID=86752 RepID=UPI002659880E|nr:zinc finger protein ZOP1 isoform X2 [Magnolia sinica]